MLGMQFAIGALNDVVDASLDRLAKPRKPIPSGLVAEGTALAIAGGGAVLGIGLSAASGVATAIVAAACLALGWAYDLRLSRTALSWLPLALALPLLPIHAWLGASGSVPGSLLTLVPVGVLAGGGLALANGLVDVERDERGGRSSIVVRLGRHRAWLLQTVALGCAAALAIALAPGGSPGRTIAGVPLGEVRQWGVILGSAALALGAPVLLAARASIRERGWELEAVGVVGLGVGWIAGVAAAQVR
jgi:4-hydroxybenzoate polyprenyltransferase